MKSYKTATKTIYCDKCEEYWEPEFFCNKHNNHPFKKQCLNCCNCAVAYMYEYPVAANPIDTSSYDDDDLPF